jgi:putative transcriptional regulator
VYDWGSEWSGVAAYLHLSVGDLEMIGDKQFKRLAVAKNAGAAPALTETDRSPQSDLSHASLAAIRKRALRRDLRAADLDLEPADYGPDEVAETREQLGVSQAVFAKLIGVSVDTVQSWEQGRREPSQLARRLMEEIDLRPDDWCDWLDEAAGIEQ